MNENKANRVLKLEQKQSASDQKKDYCGCWCHDKTLGDYVEITDEFGQKYRKADGSEGNMHDAWLEHHANKPPCLCNH